jgi:hypothetical protein
MELTKNELLMLRGYLNVKRMYKGANLPRGVVIWEDWMEETFAKVEKEIKEKYPDTKPWSPYGSFS